jgi:phosphotransferase system IIB component
MNEKLIAERIISYVGGIDNISSISHCAVRLRLSLKNGSLLDKSNISESVPEVKGIIKIFGEYHLVVGPSLVQKLYQEISNKM